MLEEARASLFIRHHVAEDPSAGLHGHGQDAVREQRHDGLGLLRQKAPACSRRVPPRNLIVRGSLPFTPATEDNVYGQILFGAAAERVLTTICDGKVLMRDGKLLSLDMEQVTTKARERHAAHLQRFQNLVETRGHVMKELTDSQLRAEIEKCETAS